MIDFFVGYGCVVPSILGCILSKSYRNFLVSSQHCPSPTRQHCMEGYPWCCMFLPSSHCHPFIRLLIINDLFVHLFFVYGMYINELGRWEMVPFAWEEQMWSPAIAEPSPTLVMLVTWPGSPSWFTWLSTSFTMCLFYWLSRYLIFITHHNYSSSLFINYCSSLYRNNLIVLIFENHLLTFILARKCHSLVHCPDY